MKFKVLLRKRGGARADHPSRPGVTGAESGAANTMTSESSASKVYSRLEQTIRPADHAPLLLFVPLFPEPPGRFLARAAVDALERCHPFRPELSARGAPPWNCEGLLLLLPLAREEVEPIAKVGLLRPSTLALVGRSQTLRVVPSCGWNTGMFRALSSEPLIDMRSAHSSYRADERTARPSCCGGHSSPSRAIARSSRSSRSRTGISSVV